jgi:hypothetical protein
VALRADYEPRAESLLIELVPEEELHGADDTAEAPGGCYVALDRDGRPLMMQVLGPYTDLHGVLREAAERFSLDAEALIAAATAALAAPDRPVWVEVGPPFEGEDR